MTSIYLLAGIKGYTTTSALIMAIGAQNAFILKQGLIKSHVFLIAILATIIDAFMIYLGVEGLGLIITSNYYLMLIAKYGGILFLFLYGCRCFYYALFKSHITINNITPVKKSIKSTIITLLAMSFLNPHMYIDTVLIIGTIGAQLAEDQRIYFILGAVVASAIWFFCLAYGARLLIPFFKKALAWKILDMIIGIVMWFLAYSVCCM